MSHRFGFRVWVEGCIRGLGLRVWWFGIFFCFEGSVSRTFRIKVGYLALALSQNRSPDKLWRDVEVTGSQEHSSCRMIF